MAYTNPWSVNTPVDSDPANGLGADIRKLRLDIQERMNDIVNDWTASQPITLKEGTSGSYLLFGPDIFFAEQIDTSDTDYGVTTYEGTKLDNDWHQASLNLPDGTIISKVEILLYNTSGGQINTTFALKRRKFQVNPDPIPVELYAAAVTAVNNGRSIVDISPSAGNYTVDNDVIYIRVFPASGGVIHVLGVRVTLG